MPTTRKAKTIQEMPSRYLNLSGAPAPEPSEPKKVPSMVFAGAVIAAGLVTVGGIVWMAIGSSAGHDPDSPIPETTESHRSIGAVLESSLEYMNVGEFERARIILSEATRQHPEDQDLRVAYAKALVALERPDAAYEQMEAALAIGPRRHELEFLAGTCAAAAQRLDRALEHFAMAQTGDLTEVTYPIYLGQVQRQLGLSDKAKASFMRAVNMDPENTIARGSLADMFLGENKVGMARQQIDIARKLEPGVAQWRIIDARILNREGEPEKALLVLQGMNEQDKMSSPVLRLTAECYGLLSKPQAAAEVYARAVEAKPRHPEVAFEAALWFERAGQSDKAKTYAERAAMLGNEQARQMLQRMATVDDG